MSYLPCFSAETWTLLVTFLCLLIAYGYWPYGFFRKLGISGPKPSPFFGTFYLYAKGLTQADIECFRKYGRIWGIYEGRQPVVCTMETGIIRTVLVKGFYPYFTNRRDFRFSGPLNDSLNNARDESWRRIRTSLSPSFSSGRIKEMFPRMKQQADKLVRCLQKTTNSGEAVDIREFFSAYGVDVLGSTILSVDTDSFNNPNDPVVMKLKKIDFDFSNPGFILSALFPFLNPLLEKANLCIFPLVEVRFIYNFLDKVILDREKNVHMKQMDFLQQMIDSQLPETKVGTNENKKGMTRREILSQAVISWLTGHDIMSKTLAFLSYNLATNPDAMKKLQDEIDQVFANKAPVTYTELMQMEYLDMVLNESLRMYPIALRIERLCSETIVIGGITIPKGTLVMIPVYALHHDPDLWPEPECFRPERFGKENKHSLDPYAFLPFGAGPRNCIAMRFVTVLMKLAVVQVLQNFSFAMCEETEIPLQLISIPLLGTKNPIKLKVVPRFPVMEE
ncbi:cytochrome P450 3A30-like [Megalops cyprinoides]|uniref:cytochrome P450 3A30-like n=1 Tax=Megalops cyprinoides TaxID=118141 RepID=UPI001865663D|nr:cytochrome P450 3A30-like [Megalops cyprinoides]